MLFSSMVRVRIRFSVWLISCYAHVFVRLEVLIVTVRLCVLVTVYLLFRHKHCVVFFVSIYEVNESVFPPNE